ncbi:MAG: hypothetical protein H7338_14130 [Candidatus Sericytochromatia bacterium]|nr:hypothetical protein [Candidatus Sericytochromatia bacterium]
MSPSPNRLQEHVVSVVAALLTNRVSTTDLEQTVLDRLGGEAYRGAGGYRAFAEAIGVLLTEGRLKAVKPRETNGLFPALPQLLKRTISRMGTDPATIHVLLSQLHPAIMTTHYQRHPADLADDRQPLDALDRYLRQSPPSTVSLTVNERSWQLFGDEKFLAGPDGARLLNRTGINLARLACHQTHEPFFYTTGNPSATAVLIVENKDTFFSLQQAFRQGQTGFAGQDYRLLIYGEGRKITRSLAFLSEIPGCAPETLRGHYFGDLDPEGIAIWHETATRFGHWQVVPAVALYEALLAVAGPRAPALRTAQRQDRAALTAFLAHFRAPAQAAITSLWEERRYIPQEALHAAWFADVMRAP